MHKRYYGDRTIPCAECATQCAPREARADADRAETEGHEQRQEFACLACANENAQAQPSKRDQRISLIALAIFFPLFFAFLGVLAFVPKKQLFAFLGG